MPNAVQELFSNTAIRSALFKTRYLLVLAVLFPVGWSMHETRLPAAIAVSLFGQLVQTWCFASLVKNRELTVRGPYLLSRNPMYLGRYFMILGFVVLLGRGWVTVGLVVGYTVLYYLYMDNRVRREERRLERIFGADYQTYCSEVPRFFPTLRRVGDPALWYWDWAPFLENNAHWNVLGTLVAYAAVWAIHRTIPPPW